MIRFVGRNDWEVIGPDTPEEHLQPTRRFREVKIYTHPEHEMETELDPLTLGQLLTTL